MRNVERPTGVLPLFLLATSLLLTNIGCNDFFSFDDDYDSDWEGDGNANYSVVDMCLATDLSSCIGSSGDRDNTQILDDLSRSYHEFIACGGLQSQISFGVFNIIINKVLNGDDPNTVFDYKGNGLYQMGPESPGGTYMTVEFVADRDFDCFSVAKGEVIPYDLFNLDNYVTGIDIGADTNGYVIHYDSTGPIAQLLKKSCTPSNPFRYDFDNIQTNFGELIARSTYYINDQKGDTDVQYVVKAETNRLADFIGSPKVSLTIDSATAQNSETGQNLTIDDWNIQYKDTNQVLNNRASFIIEGGAGNYYANFDYDNSSDPTDVECSCASLAD